MYISLNESIDLYNAGHISKELLEEAILQSYLNDELTQADIDYFISEEMMDKAKDFLDKQKDSMVDEKNGGLTKKGKIFALGATGTAVGGALYAKHKISQAIDHLNPFHHI